jgi:prophage regulatory protein
VSAPRKAPATQPTDTANRRPAASWFTRGVDVVAGFGYGGKSTLYDEVRAGRMTRPVKITDKATAWPTAELDAIAAARIAGATDAELQALVERLHAERQKGGAA